MRWITSLRLRVRSLLQGRQVDRELDEELQYHFDHLVDAFVASGASLEDARYRRAQSHSRPMPFKRPFTN